MKQRIKGNIWFIGWFAAIVCLEVLIALFVHDTFIRPYIGDVLAVVAVYCFARIFLPGYRLLPLGVFVFASLVEVSQAFDLVSLLGLSGSRFFTVLLGATFDWVDVLCYAIGCGLIAGVQHGIARARRRQLGEPV